MNTLFIVIPCYNEEEVLPITAEKMCEKLNFLINADKISKQSRVLFVDDGSKDKTWDIISNFSKNEELVEGLKLSRNKGHQNALLAGLMEAKKHCDMAISIDADLQDDINAIDKMVDEYLCGIDIVYGVRSSRKKDSFFKKTTAQGFYKIMKSLGVDIVYNHADFRLMSNRALQELSEYQEVNLFLRGIVPLIGFRYSTVEYERLERFAGESKYPLKKMLSFAFDGITSFSVKPIRFITVIGFIMFIISFIALIYSLCAKLFFDTVVGWTSLVGSIWMLGGIQLLSLGIIGEYVGKIYFETKKRPKYHIDENTINE
ncbi:MAG: glycosyltransferase family 2 protein [Oscillospiraceae bacterium]